MVTAVTAMARAGVLSTIVLIANAGAVFAQGLTQEALAAAEANFKTANVSGTGKLNAAEFRAFIDLNAAAKIGRAGKIAANRAYDRAFSAVDADKDGAVSWAEYLKANAN